MIAKAVISILLQNAPVSALVGNRVRPNVLKSNETYPAICINTDRMDDMGCDDSNGVKNGVIEAWIYASEYAKCAQISAAVKLALSGFSGVSGNVGISILKGKQTPDDYDEAKELHIQVFEYEAYAKIN